MILFDESGHSNLRVQIRESSFEGGEVMGVLLTVILQIVTLFVIRLYQLFLLCDKFRYGLLVRLHDSAGK